MTPAPKTVPLFAGSYTNGATASQYVDRKGFDFAVITLAEGTSNDTTNNPSVLKLTESDDTVATNFAAISGATGDSDFTIPASVTSGIQGHQFRLDLRPRKRYIKLSVSPVTTQVLAGFASLHRAKEAPVTAAEAGVVTLVEL